MTTIEQLQKNQLLATLPEAELQRWTSLFEMVEMDTGQVLFESSEKINSIYFPISAIVSLLHDTEEGITTEIAVVGREGVVGIALQLGSVWAADRAVVRSAGLALRVTELARQEQFMRNGAALYLMLRYTHALITQMSQVSLCKHYHSPDQQLCRWLLLSLDRLDGVQLVMTPEHFSEILGCNDDTIHTAALKLQRAGLIDNTTGLITVVDRTLLERRTCECYALVKSEYEYLRKMSPSLWQKKPV